MYPPVNQPMIYQFNQVFYQVNQPASQSIYEQLDQLDVKLITFCC